MRRPPLLFSPLLLFFGCAEVEQSPPELSSHATFLKKKHCGDGKRKAHEECDDGNQTPGDGCSASCTVERCGNSLLDLHEECDDGNQTPGDGCNRFCLHEACGNGILDAGEECEDGNQASGDGCSASCQKEACAPTEHCGDGVLTASEECDDGNQIEGDSCENDCTLPACGNGILDLGESCDTGDTIDGDGCDQNCTISECNNGIIAPAESCLQLSSELPHTSFFTRIQLADINGDDNLDLLSANSSQLRISLGNGDGTFQALTPSLNGSIFAPVAGDFNGDGFLDVVTVQESQGRLLLGNGDGTFQAPQFFFPGQATMAISAFDLNDDGFDDLVYVSGDTNGSIVRFGNADNPLASGLLAGRVSVAVALAVADLNNDGRGDIVAANFQEPSEGEAPVGDLSVTFGKADGTFEDSIALGNGSKYADVGILDANKDGFLDIVAASAQGGSLVVFFGNGSGGFPLSLTMENFVDAGFVPLARNLRVVDLDQDGTKDLVLGILNGVFDRMLWVRGRGDGFFEAPREILGGVSFLAFELGDLDGDQVPDLVGTTFPVFTESVYLSRP